MANSCIFFVKYKFLIGKDLCVDDDETEKEKQIKINFLLCLQNIFLKPLKLCTYNNSGCFCVFFSDEGCHNGSPADPEI